MGTGNVKGKMQLDIDAAGLKADLVFLPEESGANWNETTVFTLLAERGVCEGIDSEAVRSFFQSADPGKSFRLTVAQGTPPGLPKPESYTWADMPIPEELAEDAAKVFTAAREPEIYETTREKVKVRKKVLKKSKFPLGKSREEIVETVELREHRRKIDVPGEVIHSGWVSGGSRIAEIIPAASGVLGRDVFGKALAPEINEKEFYFGDGIERKDKELLARYSGFFRRGTNWAEVIPFQHHEWKLSFSPDHVTCFLDFSPGGSGASIPEAEEILTEAEKLGLDRSTAVLTENLQHALKEAVREGRIIKNFPLNTDSDGFFEIQVSEDKMIATLTMVKGRGKGKPLVLKEVGKAIKDSGIKGLDLDTIKQVILDFYHGKDQELKDYLLREGTPPTAPGRAQVNHETAFLEDDLMREIRQRMESDKTEEALESFEAFPPESVTAMAPVKEGQIVATLVIGKGENGQDVFGHTVAPSVSDNPGYILYENLRLDGQTVVSRIDGILDWCETSEGVLMRCRPHSDGKIELEVSSDGMSAYLSLYPPVGSGTPITRELVDTAIEEKGITTGIHHEALSKACEAILGGEPVPGLLIATGTPPTDQGDSRLHLDIQLSSGRGVSLRKDGRADFKNQDRITVVEKGTLIGTIQSPDVVPQDGLDVFGNVKKPREAPKLNLQIGEHIRQETKEDGSIVLYADLSGELIYNEKSISIRNVHTVKGDIGPKTGNIRFAGPVDISGNISPGYAVFSGSDITIGENVEAALISADGNILVNQGVKGGGKAVLRAKGEITASFIEQATVLAVGDIQVKNACLRCNIKTNGFLRLIGDKGNLVGGVCKVRKGLEAAEVGSDKGIRTQISFGQDYLVADRIELEEREIEKLKEAIAKIDASLRQYEKVGDKSRLDEARREKLKYLKIIEKRSVRLFNYREKFEEHTPSEVVVRGALYAGVVFESHGRTKEITTPQKSVKVTFDSALGQIMLKTGTEKKEE